MPLRAKLLGKKGRFIDKNNIDFYLVQRGVKLEVICVQTLVFHCTISNVSKVLRKYTQRGMNTTHSTCEFRLCTNKWCSYVCNCRGGLLISKEAGKLFQIS